MRLVPHVGRASVMPHTASDAAIFATSLRPNSSAGAKPKIRKVKLTTSA